MLIAIATGAPDVGERADSVVQANMRTLTRLPAAIPNLPPLCYVRTYVMQYILTANSDLRCFLACVLLMEHAHPPAAVMTLLATFARRTSWISGSLTSTSAHMRCQPGRNRQQCESGTGDTAVKQVRTRAVCAVEGALVRLKLEALQSSPTMSWETRMEYGHCREESAQLRMAERETQPGEALLDDRRRQTHKGVNWPHRCHLALWRRPASLHPTTSSALSPISTTTPCLSATVLPIIPHRTPRTTDGRRVRNTGLRPRNKAIMAIPPLLLDMRTRLHPDTGPPHHLARLPGLIPSCGSGSLQSTLIVRERLVLRNSRPLW